MLELKRAELSSNELKTHSWCDWRMKSIATFYRFAVAENTTGFQFISCQIRTCFPVVWDPAQ